MSCIKYQHRNVNQQSSRRKGRGIPFSQYVAWSIHLSLSPFLSLPFSLSLSLSLFSIIHSLIKQGRILHKKATECSTLSSELFCTIVNYNKKILYTCMATILAIFCDRILLNSTNHILCRVFVNKICSFVQR